MEILYFVNIIFGNYVFFTLIVRLLSMRIIVDLYIPW